MSQRTSKATRARVAAVLAAPVLALTLMAPAASAAAPVDTPAACAGTTHVSLLGHEACLTPSSDDASSSDNLLGGLLGAVTGLLGGLLGGLL
ncbi:MULTISPECIES: hypothetical protein [Streptomyces]|jgi:hypothetical protein|uniref:Uncharacterized protein n=1 Tax=Streptomyces spinosisporus TaxID=2927582 RepID=A0ABS9X9C7_9ACTN|nr:MULTISPECIES: hypothetical protein [Streptomyces]EPD67442.1 hypothetical protein HMPREF1211_01701 [Streptomyces sp. HGB0020]MCI3238663.1 hypothetical protein [Streptomyces spinosisporus]WUB34946.1 hypothetical protein OHN38_08525 [Streptomyces sp. NBC_00588]